MFNSVGPDSGRMQPSERAVASDAGQLPLRPPLQWATAAGMFQLPMRPLLVKAVLLQLIFHQQDVHAQLCFHKKEIISACV